jgi:hypothetical protein
MNIADKHSMQHTIHRVLFKLFGPLSNDDYCVVAEYFGISTVKELIRRRQEQFIQKFRTSDNVLCRMIFAKG